jgi:hypothetical protein
MSNMIFDVNSVTPEMESDCDFSIIVEGAHTFVVKSARVAENKKLTGSFLELILRLEGTERQIWHYFNIWNAKARAESMARVEFKKFCVAAGLQRVDLAKPESLIGLTVGGTVEHERGFDGKIKPVIKNWNTVEVPF